MPYDDGQVAVALRPPLDGGAWAWNSFVLCRVRDREILAFAELCDGDVIWLHGLDGERAALLEANRGVDIDIYPNETTTAARWRATVVLEGRLGNIFRGSMHGLRIERERGATGRFVRIVYKGIALPGYSHAVWLQTDDKHRRNVGYSFFELFDRRIILSCVGDEESPENQYVGVTIDGGYPTQAELDAIELVLYLLAGVGGVRQCVEMYDDDARWGSTQYHRLGHAAFRERRFIFPAEECVKAEFYERIAEMCVAAKGVIERAVPLRALLFHVFASQQPVPEIAITHLAIALDGIKTAVVEKIQGEGKLMPQPEFCRRIRPVIAAARAEFSAEEDVEKLNHLLIRINNSNNWSEKRRWQRFWSEYVQYEPTAEEERILEHRGSAIHSAYILLTEYDLALRQDEEVDGRAYEVRLAELISDAAIFRNVLNRVLLMLLRYRGPIVDFSNHQQRLNVGDPHRLA
jgi:hypothetical protein